MTKKPHPQSRTRGKKDEPEDKFLAWVLEGWTWAQENSQVLILGLVSLAVVIAASVYYVNYRAGLEEGATTQLESIHQTIGMGQTEPAKQQLDQFLEEFGDTDLAAEARLLLGQLHLDDGNAELALSVLEPATSSLRRPISVQAAFLKGAALEELERWEEAEETYLEIANASDMSFQINEALAAAARIRATNGDLEGAAELYQELLAVLDEDDSERGLYEMRLAEVQARLEG